MGNSQALGNQGNGRAYLLLIIGVIFLAFTAPWVKLSNFEPATSVLLRCGLGFLALVPFMIREAKKHGSLSKTGIMLSLLAGLFLGIDFTAWNYSIYYVGSGIASVLLNMQVIILPALAFLFDREKIPKSYFIIAPIMILGVVMTGGIFDAPDENATGPLTIYGMNLATLGTIAGIISGVCYGIYLYTSRKASSGSINVIVQPMAYATLAQLIAPTLWILFTDIGEFNITQGVLVDGLLPMNPETTLGDPITSMNWFWMIVLAILGQAVAWTFVQYGAVRLNATIVAGILLLSPIATVALIAVVLFGEIPSTMQAIGVVIALGAVAYQNGLHRLVFKGKKA